MPSHSSSHQHNLPALLQAAEQTCLKNGAQLTELRREVLTLVFKAKGPVTAYQLLDQLKATRKSAVPPTIYRSLEFLLENGLVHKIERLNAFVSCAEADHQHADAQFLICKTCGAVTELEDHAISEAIALAASKRGFSPSRTVVEMDGVCANCAKKQSSTSKACCP